MDIGEAVAVLVDIPGKVKCPFCDSKADSKFEKKEMTNDAADLADNYGGMPYVLTTNPESTKDYYFFEKYWKSDSQSQLVLNPHHLLPGNASVARCPEILKWMAGTSSVKKREHSKTVMDALKKVFAKARNVTKAQRAAKIASEFAKSFPPKPMKESPNGVVVFAMHGEKVDSFSQSLTKNYVTGKIAFDVNDAPNCMWLPSHCAVENWSEMLGVPSWHQDQDSDKVAPSTDFEVAYAYNTMKKTRAQFHDAHPAYSEEVINQLKKLDTELQRLADLCLQHENTRSKKDGPYPAPEQLTPALYKLAELCSRRLDVKKTKPAKPWYTSDLSLRVAKVAKR